MDDANESLLLRWSRRKHAARQDKAGATDVASAAGKPAEVTSAGEPAPAEAAADEPIAVSHDAEQAEAGMAAPPVDLPDVETLTYESDFSAFMSKGVPETLKKQALRKLWLSNPLFANLDGLNDYDPINMKFLEQLEGPAEAIAEVSRGLRDKIMDAKRARDEAPRGRRTPPAQRQAQSRTTPAPQPAGEGEAEPNAGEKVPEIKRYDA
jgi:Protein of unknown function (DUF3306)